jgi:hypothetical protein
MRVMAIVKATTDSEAGKMPSPSEIEIRPLYEMEDFA